MKKTAIVLLGTLVPLTAFAASGGDLSAWCCSMLGCC